MMCLGCTTYSPPPVEIPTNPDTFSKYQFLFQEYTGIRADIPIVFGFFYDPETMAQCRYYDETRVLPNDHIVVDPLSWAELDIMEREVLILHELAHCILKRNHDKKTFENGTPATLMFPRMSGDEVDSYVNRKCEVLENTFGFKPLNC
jgi:hypothetical protein